MCGNVEQDRTPPTSNKRQVLAADRRQEEEISFSGKFVITIIVMVKRTNAIMQTTLQSCSLTMRDATDNEGAAAAAAAVHSPYINNWRPVD